MAEGLDSTDAFHVMCKSCGTEFKAPGNCPDCGVIFHW